jgi:ankyrin repeat protein
VDEFTQDMTIIDAIQAGDVTRLQNLGRRAVRVASALPLCVAAEVGTVPMLACLIKELGAGINKAAVDPSLGLCRSLFIAAMNARMDLVRCMVVELGADVNHSDLDGYSILYFLAQAGKLAELMCMVTELGADINMVSRADHTPLMAASHGKHYTVNKKKFKHY